MKHVDIWTDGASKGNPGSGGYGVVIKYQDNKGEIKRLELNEAFEETTNNRMELLSAIVALEKLKEPCDVTLSSDSKYLVDAFNQNWIDGWIKKGWKTSGKQPVKNVDLWKRLINLTEKHDVKFVWVKGHNGHEKQACQRAEVLPEAAHMRHQNQERKNCRQVLNQ